jgi:hypothetical protein
MSLTTKEEAAERDAQIKRHLERAENSPKRRLDRLVALRRDLGVALAALHQEDTDVNRMVTCSHIGRCQKVIQIPLQDFKVINLLKDKELLRKNAEEALCALDSIITRESGGSGVNSPTKKRTKEKKDILASTKHWVLFIRHCGLALTGGIFLLSLIYLVALTIAHSATKKSTIDDATASHLYDKWDTATPEEQDAMRPQLNAWADSKEAEAKAASDKKFEDIYSDPKTLGGFINQIKNEPWYANSINPMETAMGAKNMAYLSNLTGKNIDDIGQNWPDVRAGYAKQFHGKIVQNDRQLYDLIAQDVAQKKAQRIAQRKIRANPAWDALERAESKEAAAKASFLSLLAFIPLALVRRQWVDKITASHLSKIGLSVRWMAAFLMIVAIPGARDHGYNDVVIKAAIAALMLVPRFQQFCENMADGKGTIVFRGLYWTLIAFFAFGVVSFVWQNGIQ